MLVCTCLSKGSMFYGVGVLLAATNIAVCCAGNRLLMSIHVRKVFEHYLDLVESSFHYNLSICCDK
jgi:hypothetical protein